MFGILEIEKRVLKLETEYGIEQNPDAYPVSMIVGVPFLMILLPFKLCWLLERANAVYSAMKASEKK